MPTPVLGYTPSCRGTMLKSLSWLPPPSHQPHSFRYVGDELTKLVDSYPKFNLSEEDACELILHVQKRV